MIYQFERLNLTSHIWQDKNKNKGPLFYDAGFFIVKDGAPYLENIKGIYAE